MHIVRRLLSPSLSRLLLGLLWLGLTVSSLSPQSTLAATPALVGIETGLPLPRFVSLKAGKVNVRVGPSRSHPVLWIFQRKGMPVEVIAEFEHWRRIRDADGDVGWIFHSLLDGRRTAVVKTMEDDETMPLHATPDAAAEILAAAEPGVVVKVETCQIRWCLVGADGYAGWSLKEHLWGIYPEESFE